MLERRLLLAADLVGADTGHDVAAISADIAAVSLYGAPRVVTPLIVAGDPNGSPADSVASRVDANTTSSPFAGVGSLFMRLGRFNGYICTATPIDASHVLTAAHCLDTNDDGAADFSPSKVQFNLNYGSDLSSTIRAHSVYIHPDFTGFANPVVNDDLAVVRLESDLPPGVPIYDLYRDPVAAGDTFVMVGYGRSGTGVDGYTTNASLTVKRAGSNNADGFETDDEGVGGNEVFLADFDGPTAGPLGGPSLGNDVETTLGGGDSGGPSFLVEAGVHRIAAVNTFSFQGGQFSSAPLFGSGLGGILVYEHLAWIDSITAGNGSGGGDGGGGDKNGKGPPGGKGKNSASLELVIDAPLQPVVVETDFGQLVAISQPAKLDPGINVEVEDAIADTELESEMVNMTPADDGTSAWLLAHIPAELILSVDPASGQGVLMEEILHDLLLLDDLQLH